MKDFHFKDNGTFFSMSILHISIVSFFDIIFLIEQYSNFSNQHQEDSQINIKVLGIKF